MSRPGEPRQDGLPESLAFTLRENVVSRSEWRDLFPRGAKGDTYSSGCRGLRSLPGANFRRERKRKRLDGGLIGFHAGDGGLQNCL